jgi:dCTP deaminase
MSFWSSHKINSSAKAASIISDFDASQIDCNAYTLRMGNEYFCTLDNESSESKTNTKKMLNSGESFVIHPGQFAFLPTRETIHMPKNVMGFISIKATTKFHGLVNVSGFHVDPGYRGRIIFAVFNAGPSRIHLEEGMPLFLIWFADLDGESQHKDNKGSKSLNDLIKGMNREVISLQSLHDQLSEVKSKMRTHKIYFTIAVAVFLTVFTALIIPSLTFLLQRGILSLERPGTSPMRPVEQQEKNSPKESQAIGPTEPMRKTIPDSKPE